MCLRECVFACMCVHFFSMEVCPISVCVWEGVIPCLCVFVCLCEYGCMFKCKYDLKLLPMKVTVYANWIVAWCNQTNVIIEEQVFSIEDMSRLNC
jgi:hypothetical protein